ncbi:MAG: MFS transporter [Anaerolineales bacterium]|jgi:predicted MFS family arabinose efflux permease
MRITTDALHLIQGYFPRERKFSRNAWLFLLSTLIDGVATAGISLFFNLYILAQGYNRQFLGLVNSLPFLVGLLLGLPMGVLADRIGFKRAMLLGMFIYLITYTVVMVTPSAPVLLLAISVYGIGWPLYFLSTTPLMMTIAGRDGGTYLISLNFGLVTVAGAGGSLLAGLLPGWFAAALRVGADSAPAYRAVLLALLAVGALSILPLLLIRENRPPATEGPRSNLFGNALQALRTPTVRRLALPSFLIGIGAAILIPYMNVFFRAKFSLANSWLGVLFSLSAILTAAGTIAGPRLSEKLGGKVRAVAAAQGLSIVFLLLMGFWPGLLLAGFAFLARAMLMNMTTPLYSAFAMEQAPESGKGLVSSVLFLASQIGFSFGPFVSGFVQDRWGFPPLFISTAIVYALAAAATFVFFKGIREPRESPGSG